MSHHDRRWRLVCYDIRDPGRWRQVHRIVKGFGRRVQLSVYRCRLDERQTEQMRWELSKVMASEDDLLIVDLCPSCAERVVARNDVESWTTQPPRFHIAGRREVQASVAGEAKSGAAERKPNDTDKPDDEA